MRDRFGRWGSGANRDAQIRLFDSKDIVHAVTQHCHDVAPFLKCQDHGLFLNGWNWYFGSDSGAITTQQFDFQTVVTHELGHALGLGHSTDTGSVMFPFLGTGEARRALTANDLTTLAQAKDDQPEPLMASQAAATLQHATVARTAGTPDAPSDVRLVVNPSASTMVDSNTLFLTSINTSNIAFASATAIPVGTTQTVLSVDQGLRRVFDGAFDGGTFSRSSLQSLPTAQTQATSWDDQTEVPPTSSAPSEALPCDVFFSSFWDKKSLVESQDFSLTGQAETSWEAVQRSNLRFAADQNDQPAEMNQGFLSSNEGDPTSRLALSAIAMASLFHGVHGDRARRGRHSFLGR